MIQSLLRALELLEYLKEPAHDYTIAELADALQLPRSTVHRMLQTFCESVSWSGMSSPTPTS